MNILIIFLAEYFIIFVVFIALIYFWKINSKLRISLVKLSAISLPLSYISAKILQLFINDPRPFVVNPNIKPLFAHIPDNGFPSDHTLLTMTIAAIIFSFNRKLGILLAIFSLIIGFSRVAAGVHHSLDIIGAAIIAVLATSISYVILKYFRIYLS